MNDLGGKSTCKYYATCGSTYNCKQCTGYEKETSTAYWVAVNGVFTPGGDPCYRCPKCGFKHVYGIENPTKYNKCPSCGIKLKYPKY